MPCATAPSVPKLASFAHPPSAPTVPTGSAIAHKPPAIIASIISACPTVSATRRRTSPLYAANTDASANASTSHGAVNAACASRNPRSTPPIAGLSSRLSA